MSATISSIFSVARAMISGRSTLSESRSSKKAFSKRGGVFVDGQPGLGRVGDDLVVDVGDVHDVADAIPCCLRKRRRTSTWRKVRKFPMWP